jgi:predicted ATP-grasp superfamily ATP-dependent carboligase
VAADGGLMILGASVRAAAFSALRAGLSPWCADLFADRDLRARCPSVRLPGRSYPAGFLSLIDRELPGPWMYTGGLENAPDLVRRLALRRPLWGNGEYQLRRARDPLLVRRVLRAAGLPVPAAHRRPGDLLPVFRWLRKPCRGAGGAGIRFWEPGARGGAARAPGYFQEYIDGEAAAALYVGDGRHAWLLGLTRQLVGLPWLHAAPFHYCGSIGSLEPDDALRADLTRLGTALASGCGLRGLFGVDGILRDGEFWPVEVNPRYTASVEVLEYATGLKALAWHELVFILNSLPTSFPPLLPSPAAPCVGKAVLFAPRDGVFPAEGPWTAELRSPTPLDEMPPYADVPAAGERIRAGRPVLTFFARAESPDACEEVLRRTAGGLDRQLFGG